MGCKTCGGYRVMDSLTKAAKDLLLGNRVDSVERKRRWNICAGSPKNKRCKQFKQKTRLGKNRCRMCGCFIKKKVMFRNQTCPVYKWIRVLLKSKGFVERTQKNVVFLTRKDEEVVLSIDFQLFTHNKGGEIVKHIKNNNDLNSYINEKF